MILGDKYRAFMRHSAEVEFLEGTTAAGKTTVAVLKFFVRVAQSDRKQHILSGLDLGTIEKNIISKEHGILDELGRLVEYHGSGTAAQGMAHIVFTPKEGESKIIFVLGYADKARWKKALGGQYGCLFIDEVNIADIDFVREAVMRSDYLLATLNPDDPSLPVYGQYINKASPVPGWCADTPESILNELTGEHQNWSHWFFNFNDNVSLTADKIERIKRNVPRGTKLWKNKVEGLRGRSTGLVFPTYDPKLHDLTLDECVELIEDKQRQMNGEQTEWFTTFTSGLDTAYSSMSADTTSMTFGGITNKGRYVLLECKEYNNALTQTPLAPTDTVKNYVDFLSRMREQWGLARHVFIDSADQATITEARKWKRAHPECMHIFEPSHKKMKNIDRIELQLSWMGAGDPCFKICAERCAPYVRELNCYSWDETKDSTPEDANDHSIQSCQYSWLPYVKRIGYANGSNVEDEGLIT